MLHEATFNGIYNIVSEMFEAPERELVVWIEQNTKHFLEFDQWYKDCDPKAMIYLDTQDREHVYDVIARYFLKQPWPRYGDGDEQGKTFMENLGKAINRYQWKLRS